MSGAQYIEILFGLMGLIMVYINLVVLSVTFGMVLDAKKFDWLWVLAGVTVHVISAIPLAIAIWGVSHF